MSDIKPMSISSVGKPSIKVGDVFYRVFDYEDGGGYCAQQLTVQEVTPDNIVCKLFFGQLITLDRSEEEKFYTSKLECEKECWRLDGIGDPFERLCKREGITSEEGKAAKLAEQMDMWGALDYDDLLTFLM